MTPKVVAAVAGAAVLAVALGLFAFRSSRPPPEPQSSFRPAPPSSDASSRLGAEAGAPSDKPGTKDAPLTDLEMRESRITLSHEQCEDGAQRIASLEAAGKDAGGPQAAMRTVSLCLHYGNVAWYKCVLRAASAEDAHTCTRRLMSGANVP